jgi:Integrase core domain
MNGSKIRREIVEELHRPARRRFTRRTTIAKGIGDLYQSDLVEVIPDARLNGGNRYILTTIDVFTKKASAVPVRRKTGANVKTALQAAFREIGRVPRNLQTDHGREFYNASVRDYLDENHVNHYSTFSAMKAAVVERFNRTLKGAMWKEFSFQRSHKWLALLPKLVERYNNTIHRTTGMRPNEVREADVPLLLLRMHASDENKRSTKFLFKVGDRVRISKFKALFEKGYTPNWSGELFTVAKVDRTNPPTYVLQDDEGEIIKGGFYSEELKKVKYPTTYLMEKIVKRNNDKILVKWLGRSQPSWEDKNIRLY